MVKSFSDTLLQLFLLEVFEPNSMFEIKPQMYIKILFFLWAKIIKYGVI